MKQRLRCPWVSAWMLMFALPTALSAAPSGNMLGRQSHNEGILVLPVPGPVTVDGDLSDWDFTGRIWVFADTSVRNRYSAQIAAMWDTGSLYLAVKWRDPTPMYSTVNPDFSPSDGWKSDSLQLRIRTPQRASWLTTWYYAPRRMPVLHIAYWKDLSDARAGQDVTLLRATEGGTDLGRGVEMAYREDPDAKGFIQEIKLPWDIIFRDVPAMQPGLTFRLGFELLWGDPTGKTWPIHRYADNMQPGQTSREFYWSAQRAWGDARLVAEGNVPLRRYGKLKFAADRAVNREINAVPAPGPVALDGALDEWDLSGGILSCMDVNKMLHDYATWFYMMYDGDALYVAADVTDASPMVNGFDPHVEPLICHRGDTVFMRFQSGERFTTLFAYYWSARNQPAVVRAEGREWHTTRRFSDAAGQGVRAAFRKRDDGKGYVGEVRIPWSAITGAERKHGPGDVLPATLGTYWSGMTPTSHFAYNYFDLVGEGQELPTAGWWHTAAWGAVRLSPRGRLKLATPPWLQQVPAEELAARKGSIPIRVTVPENAARFTVAINDADGKRVRNLAGDLDPDPYAIDTQAGRRTIEVMWDGLDDRGALVGPGGYQVVGLTHEGLGAEYDMCFYNPGTPPWKTRDGSGGWGSNHNQPKNVATAGDWMIVSWASSEGASAVIGIAPDGRKKWGEVRGATYLAADAEHVYTILGGARVEEDILNRYAARDGSYRPFELDGKARPFDLPVADIFDGAAPGAVTGMAAHAGTLALAMSEGQIALLDAASARLRKLIPAPAPSGLAFAPDGALYALLDARLHSVDPGSGSVVPVPTPGLGQAADVAVDSDGNIVVADVGPDSQVKAYTPAGKLVYTCGRKGGRPVRGKFDKQAMVSMSSVAVDSTGHVWVVESWNFPRRVSVWSRGGKLVRDYIGNAAYAASGCYLHDQNPALAYVGPIEMKLDRKRRTWDVTQVLWVPDEGSGESFSVSTRAHAAAQRFTSDVSGRPREYMFCHPYDSQSGNVVLMKRGGRWQPVAAVCWVGHISGRISHYNVIEEAPSGEFADLNAHDGVYWNDHNRDGRVQRTECVIVPTDAPGLPNDERRKGEGALPLYSGWGGRMGADLVFYATGLTRYTPLRITKDGAPIYGPESRESFGPEQSRADIVPVPEEDLILCLSFQGYPRTTSGMLGIGDTTGDVLWSYPNPYPGVHGSHRAPMSEPGLVIGPLKICGVAHVSDQVGRVLALRGNLGEDYYMTTDGLYVGAMFRDGRLPGDSLPPREELLRGMPMEALSEGSEPFNGWFGRQSDGKIRMVTSIARTAGLIIEVKGLESIRRFRGPTLAVDAAILAKADEDNQARAAASAQPKEYAVRVATEPPRIDGGSSDWSDVPAMELERVGSPTTGTAKLRYDGERLYALFEVQDTSPWRNAGKDLIRLFKTGDAVDLQLSVAPAPGERQRGTLLPGDLRVLFAQLAGEPVTVLMKPIDAAAAAEARVTYRSPVGEKSFDRVELIEDAEIKVRAHDRGYCVEAAIPFSAIGLSPRAGMVLRGDAGFISSDADGTVNTARTYWANKRTNLVSDEPSEAWLYPAEWGNLTFEGAQAPP